LQKINFGSASMLRPLMWFDQMDPRDPLQLTDGVWGLLGRYYFLNNANIWLVGTCTATKGPRPGKLVKPASQILLNSAAALQIARITRRGSTYHFHHRTVDTTTISTLSALVSKNYPRVVTVLTENGMWASASGSKRPGYKNTVTLGPLTHQEIINLGADYTLGYRKRTEYHLASICFSLPIRRHLPLPTRCISPGTSASYPIGMFDNISTPSYITTGPIDNTYNFINWRKGAEPLCRCTCYGILEP
jgi:hypothetical protein